MAEGGVATIAPSPILTPPGGGGPVRRGPPAPPPRFTPVTTPTKRPSPLPLPKIAHSPLPSPILRKGNRKTSGDDIHRDTVLRSAVQRQTNDRPSSGSSSGSVDSGTAGSTVSSAGSAGSTGNGSMNRVKRVQIVTDSPYDELPPYRIDRNSIYRVSFPGRTWDIMMQGFRIALEYDNVFTCDHFLGRDNAERVLTELRHLKHTGQFERHMRRGPGQPSLNYACLFLMDQEQSHRHVDALVLMVYKLACYYCDDWDKVSVELSFYPEGHLQQVTRAVDSPCPPANSTTGAATRNHRLLKCVYFPNNDWNFPPVVLPDDSMDSESCSPLSVPPAMLTVQNQNRKPPHQIEPMFDRLVVFWGDTLDHVRAECPDERYGITVWLRR